MYYEETVEGNQARLEWLVHAYQVRRKDIVDRLSELVSKGNYSDCLTVSSVTK